MHSKPRATQGTRVTAHVKWFNGEKGFGFVSPSDGAPDAFLHASVLGAVGLNAIAEGTEIVCEVGQGPKGPQVVRILEVGNTQQRAAAPAMGGGGAPAGGEEASVTGAVKWFKPEKGFGFIAADDGGKDVFIHKSVLRRCGLVTLDADQRVRMSIQTTPKGREATWIGPA
ncbi:MAG: cold shock domain-containing protein [Alphaproteobacteria bacterium]|nr:cold shock domain-containing protein [Alphaproteobacteria bacterium]